MTQDSPGKQELVDVVTIFKMLDQLTAAIDDKMGAGEAASALARTSSRVRSTWRSARKSASTAGTLRRGTTEAGFRLRVPWRATRICADPPGDKGREARCNERGVWR